jgi:hypothetical protein
MLSSQDTDQMLRNAVHIYPEDRTKTTLANLISATEILCSLSQVIVREDFHTMYIWNNKARPCKNGKLHECQLDVAVTIMQKLLTIIALYGLFSFLSKQKAATHLYQYSCRCAHREKQELISSFCR